ncbi:translationally-controlled tumor protein homolog [Branchiostoma floridae x Branchiostoma belcheri]
MGPRSAMLFVLFLCATTTHSSVGMIIYKDVFTGDEMFSDVYKVTTTDDEIFYEVEGKVVTRKEGSVDDSLIGGDATAQEVAESIDESAVSGVNIVLNHNLQETQFTKHEYMEYMKEYMKKVKEHLEEEQPERVEPFMVAATPAVKHIVQNLENWQFFIGETENKEGMVALLNYRDDRITPYMLFFKDGLREERA